MKSDDLEIQSLIDINYTALLSTEVDVQIYLARTKMNVKKILELKKGSIINLEKAAGESADIHVNNRMLGKGEIMVYDKNFIIRLHKIPNANEIVREIIKEGIV